MPLVRVTSQRSGTLEEFYERISTTPNKTIGQGMLSLLPALRELVGARAVWGLTSHFTLWLLNSDDWQSDWLVQIETDGHGRWRIGYKIKPDDAPWPNAMVTGTTTKKSEALDMVRIAIERSGGW